MTSDVNTHRKGAAAYRNGNAWAKQQRDEAIKQANERAAGIGTGAPTTGISLSARTEASVDDSIDHASRETLTPIDPFNASPIYESENVRG